MKLTPCPFCKQPAMSFSVNMTIKGCNTKLWATECDHMEDIKELPHLEHNLTVYGSTKEESEGRWNALMSPVK